MKLQAKTIKSPKWAVWMAVLVLFAQVQGLIPLLFAGLAWIDGEHHVELDSEGSGYHLVLRHDADAAPDSAYSCHHQHCLMDRLLVVFANDSSNGEADHVFSFNNVDQSEDTKHLKALPAVLPSSPLPAMLVLAVTSAEIMEPSSLRPHLLPFGRPPPTLAATSFIRQTVLII